MYYLWLTFPLPIGKRGKAVGQSFFTKTSKANLTEFDLNLPEFDSERSAHYATKAEFDAKKGFKKRTKTREKHAMHIPLFSLSLSLAEPNVRLELTTYALRMRRSTG